MKKLLLAVSFLMLICGCASNANQKISSPLIGFVQNEYIIVNVTLDNDMSLGPSATNSVLKRLLFSAATNGAERASSSQGESLRRVSLGRGNEVIAVDNQILVGHDIGNATSNEVNASASIPLNL